MDNVAARRTGHVDPGELPIQPRPTLGYRIVRSIAKPVFLHLLVRVKVRGVANVPKGPYVAVANHLSGLDAPIAMLALPIRPRLHILGDPRGLVNGRIRWWFIRKVGGLIPIDRQIHGDDSVRRSVVGALNLGCSALVFAEGDCGPFEGSTLPFKKGFAHFAAQTGLPVVPITISGTRTGWLLKRVHVRISAPIESRGRTVDELVDLSRAAVEAGFVAVPTTRRGPKLFAWQMSSKRPERAVV